MSTTITPDGFNYVVKTEYGERVFKGKYARRDANRYARLYEDAPEDAPTIEEKFAELEARIARLEAAAPGQVEEPNYRFWGD